MYFVLVLSYRDHISDQTRMHSYPQWDAYRMAERPIILAVSPIARMVNQTLALAVCKGEGG